MDYEQKRTYAGILRDFIADLIRIFRELNLYVNSGALALICIALICIALICIAFEVKSYFVTVWILKRNYLKWTKIVMWFSSLDVESCSHSIILLNVQFKNIVSFRIFWRVTKWCISRKSQDHNLLLLIYSQWKKPEDKPIPLIWFMVFFVGLCLNILSIHVNASESCKSTACLIFYVVNGFGIVLDAAFLWFWWLKCMMYWKKWCAINQDWFITDTKHCYIPTLLQARKNKSQEVLNPVYEIVETGHTKEAGNAKEAVPVWLLFCPFYVKYQPRKYADCKQM